MSEILNYLNSPHLVANFQKIFGVEPQFNKSSDESSFDKSLIDSSFTDLNSSNEKEITSKEINSKSTKKRNITLKTNVETIGPTSNNHENSTNKHKQSTNVKQLVNNTDHSHIISNTTIHNKFWFYLFHLGAAFGNEIFYCLFFPFWFWNVDSAIGRKVGFLWGIFMYIGQATKDLLCMPRPASPPVVKLEERYVKEYGFPSTHAMVSAGLPISVVVLSYSRYNINLPLSILLASAFCLWVCSSRLYLGMHSLLDVIAGVLYSILILILAMPILEPADKFILDHPYSPLVTFVTGFLICHFYPSLKQWSTARSDATTIIGSVVGFSIGSYINNYLGYLNKPAEPPLYDIHFPDAMGYLYGVIRTILGLLMLYMTRVFFKSSLLKFLCKIHGLDSKDPRSKQEKKIELPYCYITYFSIGLNIAFTSPYVFRMLDIQRDLSYTEI